MLSVEKNLFSTIVDELNLRGAGQRAYQLDPALQDLFLKARALQARRGKDNVAEAVALFEQIIEVDENFAPAYAGLASALGELTSATGDVEMAPPDPRMGRAALKAIQLDSELAEAHAARGLVGGNAEPAREAVDETRGRAGAGAPRQEGEDQDHKSEAKGPHTISLDAVR